MTILCLFLSRKHICVPLCLEARQSTACIRPNQRSKIPDETLDAIVGTVKHDHPHDDSGSYKLSIWQLVKAAKSKDSKKRRGQNIENDEEYSPSKKKKKQAKIEPEEYEPQEEKYIPPKLKKDKGKAKKQVKTPVKQETKGAKKGVKKEDMEKILRNHF